MNENELNQLTNILLRYCFLIEFLKNENEYLKQKVRNLKCANQLNKG